jgi:hypothetical protein
MDFKKFLADAGTSFNRVVQMTQENLGNVEKTEYDPQVENLMLMTDNTEKWTKKIVDDLEAFLQPNPALRLEEFVADRLEKKVERQKPADVLGETLQAAGVDLGPTSPYGDALQQTGRAHVRLGNAERHFINQVTSKYLRPLKSFLENEIETIRKERSILENCRLDLDCAKNKLRKVVNEASKKAIKEELVLDRNDEGIKKAEIEVHNVQSVFDKQLETTKMLMESVEAAHTSHLQYLLEYVDAAVAYETQRCHHMQELQTNLKQSLQ